VACGGAGRRSGEFMERKVKDFGGHQAAAMAQ
jgi:hypothetical protein